MRRPIDRAVEVTGDRATHAEVGVGPANDYALPNGAEWKAPLAGVAYPYTSSTGGYSTRFVVDGATLFLQHGRYDGRPAGRCDEGDTLGIVGQSGSSWFGYHLHVWVEPDTGGRLSFEEWLASLGFRSVGLEQIATPTVTSTAGGGSKPFPIPTPEEKKRKADRMLTNIWNTNPKPVGYRGATVGESTIEVQKNPTVPKAAARSARLYGPALEVTQEEFDGYVADVNARRTQLGLPPIIWPAA